MFTLFSKPKIQIKHIITALEKSPFRDFTLNGIYPLYYGSNEGYECECAHTAKNNELLYQARVISTIHNTVNELRLNIGLKLIEENLYSQRTVLRELGYDLENQWDEQIEDIDVSVININNKLIQLGTLWKIHPKIN